jgi:hypothetical protein
MTFAKPESKEKDEKEHNSYCSVDGCQNIWAVRQDGDKQKCSHHQWLNSGKAKPVPILANYPKKVKTVSTWYDEVEF